MPLDPGAQLEYCVNDSPAVPNQTKYQSIIGSLMYAAIGTRPDIVYAVMALSKYSADPRIVHLEAACRCSDGGGPTHGIGPKRQSDGTATEPADPSAHGTATPMQPQSGSGRQQPGGAVRRSRSVPSKAACARDWRRAREGEGVRSGHWVAA